MAEIYQHFSHSRSNTDRQTQVWKVIFRQAACAKHMEWTAQEDYLPNDWTYTKGVLVGIQPFIEKKGIG
jgi:hypothetical protein